jgi:hypothetical protein
MIVVFNPSTVESESYPLTHARIGYHRIDGTASASSTANGHPASAAKSMNTYETWGPTGFPAWWKIDAGSAVNVDYCGIAGHTLEGNSVLVQYSSNDSDWTDVGTASNVTDGKPILIMFPEVSARYWRVLIAGSAATTIAHIRFGQMLAMMRPIFAGHSPAPLNRDTVISQNRSERGQFLGNSIIRSGVVTAADWKHLTPEWYRSEFDPFVLAARTDTFFFAWRPEPSSPSENDVAYCWTKDDISPTNMGIRDWMQVSLSMQGVNDYE